MKTFILFLASLFLTGITFFDLSKDKNNGTMRLINQLGFVVGLFGLMTSWFYSFFPSVRFWGSLNLMGEEIMILLWGQICVTLWGMIAFFTCIFLYYKNSEEKNSKIIRWVAGIASIGCVFLIIPMTTVTLHIKPINSVVKKNILPSPKKLHKNISTKITEEDSMIIIKQGESLCDYFSLEYALGTAMESNLPCYANDSLHTKITNVEQGLHLSKRYKIIVLVYPGQMFKKPFNKKELLLLEIAE